MPQDKIVTLPGADHPLEPRHDLIAMLEDLLEQAKTGDMREMVAVISYQDKSIGSAAGGERSNVMAMYGELTDAWCKYRENYIQK